MELPASTDSLNFLELPAPKVHPSYRDFQWSPFFSLPMYLLMDFHESYILTAKGAICLEELYVSRMDKVH